MAHHEIQPLTDLATSAVSLQYKLCTLEQQRRFRGVFLGRELVQTTIQILGDTQIHSHDFMVPNQYQASTRLKSLWLALADGDDGRSIIGEVKSGCGTAFGHVFLSAGRDCAESLVSGNPSLE